MAFEKQTAGVDLTRPRATPRWVIGAVIAIAVLVVIGMFVMWAINQAKARVLPMVPGLSSGTSSSNSAIGGELI
ncbi:hypothetical protein [uncultured Methanoregula sp.]|uniref:hypothetical protein n=1 Tax=uncultured Methanoregula sp. TaxID=1005933 RepID=UPI002AAAF416|nr:hypothetical protein [uncultured Methanoregula sp.]